MRPVLWKALPKVASPSCSLRAREKRSESSSLGLTPVAASCRKLRSWTHKGSKKGGGCLTGEGMEEEQEEEEEEEEEEEGADGLCREESSASSMPPAASALSAGAAPE
jgi:hypothetical protein